MPRTISAASPGVSGGTPKSTSRKTSTYLPPRPNISRGPNRGSVEMPKITSWPPRRSSWTSQPSTRWPAADTARSISAMATASSSGLRRSTRTAPTSLLWTSSVATALSATGKPSSAAAARASPRPLAIRQGATGTP